MKRIAALILMISISSTIVWGQESDDEFTMLNAYRDFFGQATDFSLSFIRYKPRGYDIRQRTLSWNNIPLEDWENGTIPWSIMGDLSSKNSNFNPDKIAIELATKNQGKIGGSVSNRTYRYKTSAGYNWRSDSFSAAADISRKWGNSLNIDGVSADSYSFFGSAEFVTKRRSVWEFSILYAPSDRETQRASTAEAYELTGNNLYNSAWGWQGDSKRNVRHNRAKQPIIMLNHYTMIGSKLWLNTNFAARFGSENRSGLSWQNAPNPYPDYYRYMPSYQIDEDSKEMIRRAWKTDQSVSQINFQNLYNINGYNSPHAKYIIEEYCRDLQQYTFYVMMRFEQLSGGLELSSASNRNYKRVADLMGAKHWLDIDAWVENDDDIKDQVRNNLRNPNLQMREGDVFGYDYEMTMKRAMGWLEYLIQKNRFHLTLRGEASAIDYQRNGHFEKENFAGDQSYGKSPLIQNYDYNFTASGGHNTGGRFSINFTAGYRIFSPNPSQLFISREYRNATVPESISEKIATFDLTANYRSPEFSFKGSIYYSVIADKTQLLKFYDDNIHRYTHYWLRGIEQRYAGIELSTEFDIYGNLKGSVAVALSDNRYTSDPIATQWQESNGEELRTGEVVYYDNLHTSGSPQCVAVAALNYSHKQYRFSLTANYFDNNYISISPLRRTERSSARMTKTPQEKLTVGATLDLFGGRNFYTRKGQMFGVWIGFNNLLNNKNIRAGGYESFRTVNSAASDSKYYYALGINGFVSLSFNF